MAEFTSVFLMNVPLDKDCAHTLYFEDPATQYAYFRDRTKEKHKYENCTYQRKDKTIRIPAHIDTLYADGINYVVYSNYHESRTKTFYAFITNMEYKNDGVTLVTIQTDCLQTWMFDIEVKPCFVEREHAASDTAGEHTLEEGLELGEYISNKHTRAEYAGYDLAVIIAATKSPDGADLRGKNYNNLYSGVNYYAFGSTTEDVVKINEFLSSYDSEGIGEAINCMFLAPKKLADTPDDSNKVYASGYTHKFYINSESANLEGETKIFSANKLDGYIPRNNKLMAFPYRYLLVSNNAGAAVPMKYERFYKVDSAGNKTSVVPQFVIEGALCPGCSIRMTPLNYNGEARNDEEGINMGKFPALNWSSDVYTNWITQNGVNIALQMASGVGQIVAGAAVAVGTAGVGAALGGGSIVGGVSQIAGTLAQIHQQSFAPPQAKGNLNSGDVVTAGFQNDFHFYDMSIKEEYAKILDEYFDMYGYKCHRVKIPEKAHRAVYWFTKTIDANIVGEIPQEDLQAIKDCYNRGVTFWRNGAQFKNFSAVNGIV